MMKNRLIQILILVTSFAWIDALAADKPCARADIGNAQRAIDKIVSWSQLRKAWSDYRQCDTGDVADQYTDALLRLMVDWKNVDELASATSKDPDYKAFVLDHLKSPAAKDDQPTVYSRAKKDCPKSLDAFCAEVAEAVKGAGTSAGVAKGGELEPLMTPLQIQPIQTIPSKPADKK